MVDEKVLKKVVVVILILALLVLFFFIMSPILTSIILGLLGGFILTPIHKKLYSLIKNKNISALLICLVVILIIFIPFWFLTPVIARQTFNVYSLVQEADVVGALKKIFPSVFASQEFSADISIAFSNFTGKIFSAIASELTELLFNFPVILLQFFIIFIVLFFTLRDGEKLKLYLSELSPFPKEATKKFYERFKEITNSVVIGQFIIGVVQGIVTGIGLLIFGVPNALILTVLAVFIGILPVIGPWLVWGPVCLYMLATGNYFAGIGLGIYGFAIISWVDVIIRPLLVSYKTKMHSGLILISMIGGLLVFGVIGLIIGPLVIGYLLIILDFYKNKQFSKIFFESEQSQTIKT